MKRKMIAVLSLVLIAGLVAVSDFADAYMRKTTEEVDNTFIPAYVACVVDEDFADNKKTSITVKNTGNIDAYIRVRLVSYWIDESGAIVSKSSEMPTFGIADDWIPDAGNYTYYYTKKVAPDAFTTTLLDSGSTITLRLSSEGYRQVVEVFAEAIQAEPDEAVTDSWNVTIADDVITSVN